MSWIRNTAFWAGWIRSMRKVITHPPFCTINYIYGTVLRQFTLGKFLRSIGAPPLFFTVKKAIHHLYLASADLSAARSGSESGMIRKVGSGSPTPDPGCLPMAIRRLQAALRAARRGCGRRGRSSRTPPTSHLRPPHSSLRLLQSTRHQSFNQPC